MENLTWVEVDLAAIQNNVRQMKAITQTRVMAVVKANAYGHGAGPVARAAAAAGAGLQQIDLRGMRYLPLWHRASWCRSTQVNYMATFARAAA